MAGLVPAIHVCGRKKPPTPGGFFLVPSRSRLHKKCEAACASHTSALSPSGDIFRALADPTRRGAFEKLAAGGVNASKLRRAVAISQPAMSPHLAVLRSAGLVRERRDGRFVNYEVAP